MDKRLRIEDESGIAMVIALVVLLALTVIGIASMTTSTLDVQISGNERRAAEALNLADAGMERGIMDAFNDFKAYSGDVDWSNNIFYAISNSTNPSNPTSTAYTLPSNYGDFGCTPKPACIDTQFGSPFTSDGNISGSTGSAVGLYGGARTLGDGKFRVLMLRDAGEPDELYIRSYAEHSTGARRIVEVHVEIDKIDAWRNALFGGRGTSAATITGNINMAGPVHILGTGATNDMSISGASKVMNGYQDMDAAIRGRLLDPEVAYYYNGYPVYSLESIFRVKNVQVAVTGMGEIGVAGDIDSNGDGDKDVIDAGGNLYYKAAVDAIYANKEIDVDDPNKSIHSDETVMPDGYDLGDKIQLPTLQDEYDGQWDRKGQTLDPSTCAIPNACTYLDYITTMSYELDMSAKSCAFEPNATANFRVGDHSCTDTNDITTCTCNDDNGCLFWDMDGQDGSGNTTPNLIVDGRVEITGCGNLTIAKNKAINYEGKGILYTPGNITMEKSFLTFDAPGRKFLQDDLMGVMTKQHIRMATVTQQTYMGGFYASGTIGTDFPGTIVGALVGNYFCMSTDVILGSPPPGKEIGDCQLASAASGNAADVYYAPGISDELRNVGMLMGALVYSFDSYEWRQVY
jgi:hypothetical protein